MLISAKKYSKILFTYKRKHMKLLKILIWIKNFILNIISIPVYLVLVISIGFIFLIEILKVNEESFSSFKNIIAAIKNTK